MRLAEVLGHVGIARLLARLVDRNRLPHAILIEGVPGCGRRTLGRAAAQALLCSRRERGDACGACESCRLMAAGTHPDAVELPHDSEAGEPSLDLVRDEVVGPAYTSPLMGGTRTFLLPGIERASMAVANTLLKVLEEPPRGTYLIMTTASSAGVLKTIRSRAQLYRLAPLTAGDIARILQDRGVDAETARLRAAAARGGLRGLSDDLAPAPLAAMERLLGEGLHEGVVGEVMGQLPQRLRSEEGRTLASEQRRVLATWLEALIQHLRPALAGAQGEVACDHIERVVRLQQDLERHLSPQLVVEGLALPTR
jgi:DNA polymerase-3 subunit delta'